MAPCPPGSATAPHLVALMESAAAIPKQENHIITVEPINERRF